MCAAGGFFMKAFIKKNIITIVGICISLCVVGYFCISTGLDSLADTILSLDLNMLAIAVLCMFLYWLLESVTLHLMIRHIYRGRKFSRTFRVAMIGQLYNAITPFASGGQPMQIYEMTVNDGMDAGKASAVIARRSLIFQFCVTVFSVASIIYGYSFFATNIPRFSILTIIGVGLNLIYLTVLVMLAESPKLTRSISNGVIRLLSKMRILKNPQNTRDKVEEQLKLFRAGNKLYDKSYVMQILNVVLTLVQLLFYFLVPYFIYRSFRLEGASVLLMTAASAYVYAISSLIPLPGGSGAAEGSFYLLFTLFFTAATLSSGMLLWRIITYYLCFVGGLIAMSVVKKKNTSEKKAVRSSRKDQDAA